MKTVGKVLLFLVAVVGLYALPSPSADACPEGAIWSCVERVEADEPSPERFENIDRGSRDASVSDTAASSDPVSFDPVSSDEGESDDDADADEFFEISGGDLIAGDKWEHDLLTSTKWAYDLIESSDRGAQIAVTYESSEPATSAPRVMRPQPARLQILDPDRESVLLDAELPQQVAQLVWSEGELAVIDFDGAITIFARP